jgi:G3E family GTPase
MSSCTIIHTTEKTKKKHPVFKVHLKNSDKKKGHDKHKHDKKKHDEEKGHDKHWSKFKCKFKFKKSSHSKILEDKLKKVCQKQVH